MKKKNKKKKIVWTTTTTTWSKAKQRLTFIVNFLLFDTETRTIVD